MMHCHHRTSPAYHFLEISFLPSISLCVRVSQTTDVQARGVSVALSSDEVGTFNLYQETVAEFFKDFRSSFLEKEMMAGDVYQNVSKNPQPIHSWWVQVLHWIVRIIIYLQVSYVPEYSAGYDQWREF